MQFLKLFILLLILAVLVLASKHKPDIVLNESSFIASEVYKLAQFSKIPPSLSKWSFLHEPRRFTLTTMVLDHHSEGSWFVPSLHQKYSIGWNRSEALGFLSRPYSCSIRFFGVGLASVLSGFEDGGTGYLMLSKLNGKQPWQQSETSSRNESKKLHCYYMTGKGHGSNFYVRMSNDCSF